MRRWFTRLLAQWWCRAFGHVYVFWRRTLTPTKRDSIRADDVYHEHKCARCGHIQRVKVGTLYHTKHGSTFDYPIPVVRILGEDDSASGDGSTMHVYGKTDGAISTSYALSSTATSRGTDADK